MVGGIGYVDFEPGSHRVEIGYWLAMPFRGKGLMTEAVKAFCDYTHRKFGIVRITAGVFAGNEKSAGVVERAGFEFEGLRRKVYKKDGKFIDSRVYAKIYD